MCEKYRSGQIIENEGMTFELEMTDRTNTQRMVLEIISSIVGGGTSEWPAEVEGECIVDQLLATDSQQGCDVGGYLGPMAGRCDRCGRSKWALLKRVR